MRLLSVVLVLGVLVLCGCGSSSSSSGTSTASTSTSASTSASTSTSPTHLATAKFVLHAGLAFGAFHRYIYEPLKAGEFKSVLRHKLAVIKATAAAVFVVHELKLATADAQSSPLLMKLVPQLAVLSTGFKGALVRLKAGTFKPNEIETALPGIESIKGAAASAGIPIKESAPSLP
ncbi:MAG: hypothetical protein ACYDHN_01980 [Solirubrobacteraceae bacterium]